MLLGTSFLPYSIVNPFDTPPTGRGLLRVDGTSSEPQSNSERHTNILTPCTARGMSRTVKNSSLALGLMALVFLARLPACKSNPAPWDSS